MSSQTNKFNVWYINVVLYAIIVFLSYLLLKIGVWDPKEMIRKEEFFKNESRLRMINLREAENLFYEKYQRYTGSLDTLIMFLKNDELPTKKIIGRDTITNRKTNPFKPLLSLPLKDVDTVFYFTKRIPDSLWHSPKSRNPYILLIDTIRTSDTIVDRRGKILRVETKVQTGTKYSLECPDGYGTIGDLYNDALKNTPSWE